MPAVLHLRIVADELSGFRSGVERYSQPGPDILLRAWRIALHYLKALPRSLYYRGHGISHYIIMAWRNIYNIIIRLNSVGTTETLIGI